jgi:ribonuclease Z
MSKFQLTILGTSAALPAYGRHLSSQILAVDNELYMIDCGEGTQFQLLKYRIKKQKIDHIFISHLHGDHIFGLIGFIMTLGLGDRKKPLHIYSPEQRLEELIMMQCGHEAGFDIIFHVTDPTQHQLVFESKKVAVYAIPLTHRVPCNGYLFVEKDKLPNIIAAKIKQYEIPYTEIPAIKAGADFETVNGMTIPHQELVTPAAKARKFAYCSDTMYREENSSLLQNVNLVYHEATFLHEMLANAERTMHTTALQAGQLAQKAGVKKMIIGHFSARYTDLEPLLVEARSAYEAVDLAEEGKVISIE